MRGRARRTGLTLILPLLPRSFIEAIDGGRIGVKAWTAGALLLCVAAAPANAQAVSADADQPVKPTVSAEQAMAAYRSGYTIAKRRCGEEVGGAIVVCGDRDYNAMQRLPLPELAASERTGPVRGEVPRAAQITAPRVDMCGTTGNPGSCALETVLAYADGDTGAPLLGWLGLRTGLADEPVPGPNYEQQDIDD